MSNSSEIDELLAIIHMICPEITTAQQTSFGEKPLDSGVWKLWHKDNEDVHIIIEVHEGMLYALYSNREFSNKYPIEAMKICEFLSQFSKSEKIV